MTSPKHPDDETGGVYLVERYLSPTAAEGLPAATARVAKLCADVDHSDGAVHYLYSAYLPTEDTCFCLFRASSGDAVRTVNNLAGFAFDRITDALLLVCTHTPGQPDTALALEDHQIRPTPQRRSS